MSGFKAEASRLEQALAKLSTKQAGNEAALADPALYAQDAKVQLMKLLDTGRQLAAQIAATEEAWLSATEQYESAVSAEADEDDPQ